VTRRAADRRCRTLCADRDEEILYLAHQRDLNFSPVNAYPADGTGLKVCRNKKGAACRRAN
jgi:hypothetical protein